MWLDQKEANGAHGKMKRDMDIIRDVLLHIEENPQLDGHHWGNFTPEELCSLSTSTEVVGYHLTLLVEAGFVDGGAGVEDIPVISKLTWQGHEFLDNIRDPGVWGKTKERLKDLPTVGIAVIAQIAQSEIKKRLGLP